MDFNTLRQYDFESLRRQDLGANYREIFNEIHSIFTYLNQIFFSFEQSYPNLLKSDQDKLIVIFNDFFNLAEKTKAFETSRAETLDQGISRAKDLLAEVKAFYENIVPLWALFCGRTESINPST